MLSLIILQKRIGINDTGKINNPKDLKSLNIKRM